MTTYDAEQLQKLIAHLVEAIKEVQSHGDPAHELSEALYVANEMVNESEVGKR